MAELIWILSFYSLGFYSKSIESTDFVCLSYATLALLNFLSLLNTMGFTGVAVWEQKSSMEVNTNVLHSILY